MSSDGRAGTAHEKPQVADSGTHVVPRRYMTADIPPIGGVIKQRPEDFLVDEVPQYEPVGTGEHIYMLVQKRGLSTMEMLEVLAGHFGVRRSALGYAGLKDKQALTRQVVSVHVPGKTIEEFPMLTHEKIDVLWTDYHTNKLRHGHLRGNRFSVRIRNVKPTDVVIAHRVLERLRYEGVPNRVGEQRFGMLENNHLVGRALVVGDFEGAVQLLLGPSATHPHLNHQGRELFVQRRFTEALACYPNSARTELRVLFQLSKGASFKTALLNLDEPILRYYFSAFQSAVFNAALDARIEDGLIGSLRAGDLAIKHENNAVFTVDEPVLADPATAARLSRFEISPSGPLWGATMMRAGGRTDEVELAALGALGVSVDQLNIFDERSRHTLDGKRRALRVPVMDPEVEGGVDEHGAYVRCAFELPRGSFATVVLREVMKPPVVSGEWEEPD